MTSTRAVLKLLRARWWIFLNGLRRAKGRTKVGYVVLVLVLLILAVGAFAASWFVLSLLQRPEVMQFLGPRALEGVPALMLNAVFLVVFVISFQVLLQALYLAGDMDFLLSAPVPARAVFVAKYLDAILPNLLLFGLFTLPILWGLGAAEGYFVLYYPLVLLLFLLQVLAAAGLSALVVIVVARVFPAKRVFEVVSFLGAILGMLCSQWYNLSRALFSEEVVENGPPPVFEQAIGVLGQFGDAWWPPAWSGLGLAALARGEWLIGAGYLVLGVGLACGVFALSLVVAERLYYAGWFRVRGAPGRRPRPQRRSAAPAAATGRRLGLLPSAIGAIVGKDLRVLRRDLRRLSQVISPIILAIVYAVLFLARGGASEVMGAYGGYVTIGIALFACWMLTGRLAMMGFSQEGKAYWILKAAPVSSKRLALSKWLVAFLPSAAIGLLLLIGMDLVQGVGLGDALFGVPVVLFVVGGNVGLHLAFGITGAKLDWTDPRRMSAGTSGCIASILSMAFQGVSMALFLGPAIALALLGGPVIVGQAVGLVLGGVVSLVAAFLPPLLVLKRIPRIGEAD